MVAPKDWYEATNVCAAEGKVLCGVDEPCSRSGCMYDLHYQWTGEECRRPRPLTLLARADLGTSGA